jgi:hypothetical protein
MTTQTDRAIIAMQARLNAFNKQVFTPSPWALQTMLAIADEQSDGAREQDALRKEARAEALAVRAQVAEAKARHYRRLQGV